MRTKPAYLIIDLDRRAIVRSTQRWPTLYAGEIAVRVSLEIPDEIRPVYRFVIDDEEAVIEAVTVEAEPPEDE